MKVKVCGMREAGNISDIAALQPDYLGFIFYESSPRSCFGISPELIKKLPENITPVMVTVDMEEDEMISIADKYGFQTLQLHGQEPPKLCQSLRNRGFQVWKALGVREKEDLKILKGYEGCVDAFLLDTASKKKGGSGIKFNWEILDFYDLKEDLILSGGIGPQDAVLIKALNNPKISAIDLNSRFEKEPGIKNPDLLRSFLESIRYNKSLDQEVNVLN